MTGIEMTHVPYKGSADAIKDVVAGHIQLLFSDTAPSLPLIRNGTVTLLGLSTIGRLPTAPDIVPLNEAGVPGFDAAGWFMVAGSAGTPQPIVDRLHKEFKEVMGLPDVQEAVNRIGVVPVVSPSLAELAEVHRLRKGALGQSRAAGRSRRHAVAARQARRRQPRSMS